jgi:hypothetical protein
VLLQPLSSATSELYVKIAQTHARNNAMYAAAHATHTHITLHYITLHYITLHYITLHYITLHYITLHYVALHCIALHCIALHCIALHCIALHCIALHCIALHYITLHYIVLDSVRMTVACPFHAFMHKPCNTTHGVVLVAWLSCLPCHTWCNIIIITTHHARNDSDSPKHETGSTPNRPNK